MSIEALSHAYCTNRCQTDTKPRYKAACGPAVRPSRPAAIMPKRHRTLPGSGIADDLPPPRPITHPHSAHPSAGHGVANLHKQEGSAAAGRGATRRGPRRRVARGGRGSVAKEVPKARRGGIAKRGRPPSSGGQRPLCRRGGHLRRRDADVRRPRQRVRDRRRCAITGGHQRGVARPGGRRRFQDRGNSISHLRSQTRLPVGPAGATPLPSRGGQPPGAFPPPHRVDHDVADDAIRPLLPTPPRRRC